MSLTWSAVEFELIGRAAVSGGRRGLLARPLLSEAFVKGIGRISGNEGHSTTYPG